VTAGSERRAAAAAVARAFLDGSHLDLAWRVVDYARQELAPRPEARADGDARREARELLVALGEAGWYDPIGRQDLRALCLIREAVAGASPLADAIVALQALGGTPIVLAGSESQKTRWLPEIVAGRVMTAFAMTEPDAGSDVASMQTSARREAAGWVLDGDKHLISNAGIADLYIVFAVTTPGAGNRGITAFIVPAEARGLTFAGAQVMAAPHPLGRVRFDACRVPEDAVLGTVDQGFRLGMMTLDRLRPSVGAAACGLAGRALDEALHYAGVRRQFGRTIGEFQVIQEKLGRMATELDAARLLVYRAAWTKDRGAERITLEAAMAKSFATEAAQHIVDEAVQILGGRGVLIGSPVERLYRAVRALRIYEGPTEIQRLLIGAALLKDVRP
jgi:acyl-CoA dehydrogenase